MKEKSVLQDIPQSVRLDLETLNKLSETAFCCNTTYSDIIRKALRLYFFLHKFLFWKK